MEHIQHHQMVCHIYILYFMVTKIYNICIGTTPTIIPSTTTLYRQLTYHIHQLIHVLSYTFYIFVNNTNNISFDDNGINDVFNGIKDITFGTLTAATGTYVFPKKIKMIC